MAFPVFLDTCALWGQYLCDTLLTLAEVGTYRPLWSAGVLDELARNLGTRGIGPKATNHRIGAMQSAFPDAEVTGYEHLTDTMTNDPKDRHVLAAAVRGGAAIIVTFNTKDFPASATNPYDIAAVNVDHFLLDQLDLYPGRTVEALRTQVARHRHNPHDVESLLPLLARAGVPKFAADAARHLG